MEMDRKDAPPQYSDVIRPVWRGKPRRKRLGRFVAAACLAYFGFSAFKIASNTEKPAGRLSVKKLQENHAACVGLRSLPQEPAGPRDFNKRWISGTKPLLIRNATVWTGEPVAGTSHEDARAGKGFSWTTYDIFVDHGIIRDVSPSIAISGLPHDTDIFDAHGHQLTSGIVDMHSHAGLGSFTGLQDDVNELSSDITPYVRSIDSLDPLQPEFSWIKSGGVTTSLHLPGSGNNIGGEAFVFKLAVGNSSGRAEISAADMLADFDHSQRYIKMACGENAKRVYGKVGERGPYSRLGESWEFRHAFEQAREYNRKQNDWCETADRLGAESMDSYLPEELEWETLGAVLRGQVRVNTHCYTIPDLEAFVDHTNEFEFQIRAFHHAHQTYLVPEILKRAWGGVPPASALFADNMYYKVEAYTASEQAGKFLWDNGLTPIYVSDNPVLNSQHVKFEAAKAYGNGLPYHVALAGVTSAPAGLLGLGERIGKVKAGFDADIVVWDSDPLSVGAAPLQVWIDGAAQFKDPVILKKPETGPIVPDVTLETIKEQTTAVENVILTGVSKVAMPGLESSARGVSNVVISNGVISCVGACKDQLATAADDNTRIVELKNGYITKPFTAFGSDLGLSEISAAGDTQDGKVRDVWAHSSDGLLFDTKQLEAAHKHGVLKAISAPQGFHGVSAGFETGAKHSLEHGAVFTTEAAVHYDLSLSAKKDKTPSISSAVGALRTALFEALMNNETIHDPYSEASALKQVVAGELPLVLNVHSADTITSIIKLKTQLVAAGASDVNIIIHGAAESHIVATELGEAAIPVVLAPLLPYSQSWDQKRSLTGAPLTNGTAIDHLLDAGVLVAIGVDETWETRDLGLSAGIAFRNSGGRLSEEQGLDLVSGNIYKMLGLKEEKSQAADFVVFEGSPLEIGARVRVSSRADGRVDVWV